MVRSLGSNATFAFTELDGGDAKAWGFFCVVILNLVCIYIGLLYGTWKLDAGGLFSWGQDKEVTLNFIECELRDVHTLTIWYVKSVGT